MGDVFDRFVFGALGFMVLIMVGILVTYLYVKFGSVFEVLFVVGVIICVVPLIYGLGWIMDQFGLIP